jgi:hypothetical protein
VASYAGLCPGIHLSDGRGKEGLIKRIKDGKEHRYWSVVSLSSGTTYQLSRKAFESELKHRSVVQTF